MPELTRVGKLLPRKKKKEVAFNARPFVLCGLPVRQPNATVHERRNGDYTLRIVADPKVGLPFGQDRLIPLWICTLAMQQKERMLRDGSRTVYFDSVRGMLDFFGLPEDGPHHQRMLDGFKRVYTSSIFFGTDLHAQTKVWENSRFHFFDKVSLRTEGAVDGQHRVVLSEAFFEDLMEHPIPVDIRVVRKLINFPAQMDFYIWLVWRCWRATASVKIPLVGEGGLLGQMGVSENYEPREFRRKLKEWLENIRQPDIWPECTARVSADGDHLEINHQRALP